MAQMVKNLPATQETRVWSLGQEDPLEKRMTTHSSILAWEIPWIEKPGGLQSTGSHRVRHDGVTNTSWLTNQHVWWWEGRLNKRPNNMGFFQATLGASWGKWLHLPWLVTGEVVTSLSLKPTLLSLWLDNCNSLLPGLFASSFLPPSYSPPFTLVFLYPNIKHASPLLDCELCNSLWQAEEVFNKCLTDE